MTKEIGNVVCTIFHALHPIPIHFDSLLCKHTHYTAENQMNANMMGK